MTETKEKPKIELPKNFKQKLLEVVSPNQSTEYVVLGDTCFPVQVLPIGLEKKILRLARAYESSPSSALEYSTGEICRFYYKDLRINWPRDNSSETDMFQLYHQHIEKLKMNDEVINVVHQVTELIEWQPPEERYEKEFKHYLPAHIFSPVRMYMNMIEGRSLEDIFSTMTRGALEIVKLGNMISNDRLRLNETDGRRGDKIGRQMSDATTAKEYMEGLESQGFMGIGDLFR